MVDVFCFCLLTAILFCVKIATRGNEMAEKKYKVSLEKLRKKLNELTGGPSTDFTGTLCEVVPLNKFTVLVSSNEKLKELMESGEIHKNCKFV